MGASGRVLKYVLAIALLFVAITFGMLALDHNKDPDAEYKKSAVVRELDLAERDRKDVLGILVNRAASFSDDDARHIWRWLGERQDRGEIPYLYLMSAYSARAKDAESSFRFAAAGWLVYRIDREKCGDATANQAVPIVENKFGMVKAQEMLKARPDFRKRVVPWALEYEEKHRNRSPPQWICSHGLSAFGARPVTPQSESEWQQKRAQIRKEFEARYAAAS